MPHLQKSTSHWGSKIKTRVYEIAVSETKFLISPFWQYILLHTRAANQEYKWIFYLKSKRNQILVYGAFFFTQFQFVLKYPLIDLEHRASLCLNLYLGIAFLGLDKMWKVFIFIFLNHLSIPSNWK